MKFKSHSTAACFILCAFMLPLGAQTTYYVNNLTGSDSNSGTVHDSPKLTVQSAVDAAVSGDSISIAATGQTYQEMVIVSGKTIVLVASDGVPTLAGLTIDQPSLEYELRFAESFKIDSVVFVNGLIVTGSDTLILKTGNSPLAQGFDRSRVTEGKVSHVVGNVRKEVQAARNEFPVGSDSAYRPVAITFSTHPNANITVSHVDKKPTGFNGLPIADGVDPGTPIARYPNFCWSIKTDSSISSIEFELELAAEDFSDYDHVANLRIIRRVGTIGDAQNPWSLLGIYYGNFEENGSPTVATHSFGGLTPYAALFTFGLKSRMSVANPFVVPALGGVYPHCVFKRSLVNPPLFVGNQGPITFTATVLNPIVASVQIIENDTLVVLIKYTATTFIFITGTDTTGDIATYAASLFVITSVSNEPQGVISSYGNESINFGNVKVGETKDTTFSIYNSGCFPVTITDIISTNEDFSVARTSGELIYLFRDTVRFTPSTAGHISGKLIFFTNNGSLPDTIEVSGIGDPASSVRDNTEIPLSYSLTQNYPNPFNPSTTIEFGLPGQEFVELKIYDLLGNEIETLVKEQLNPGSYRVTWEASHHAAGVYFYRLKSGGKVETKKLILLK